MTSEQVMPRTLDAAVDILHDRLSDANKAIVRDTPEDKLSRFHFPWGMHIRNEFGLWRDNVELLESCGAKHPDGASTAIIRALWEKLRQPVS